MAEQEERTRIVEKLLSLYRDYGSSDYIGEDVTQIQHALQAAEQARTEGYGSEVILGAFFHDIGHLLGEKDGSEKMVTGDIQLGIQHHSTKGQHYMESLGFTGTLPELVGMHVDAKRYLVATCKGYYDKLSEASKLTLEHQGGPMSPEEVEYFKKHHLRDIIIQMRQWDEKAKDVSKFCKPEETEAGLNSISQLLHKHMDDHSITLPIKRK